MKMPQNNFAFVDGQNLYMGTTKCSHCAKTLGKDIKNMKIEDCDCGCAWEVDVFRFREYLRDKYSVTEAYYFLGYINEDYADLYTEIQKAGFILQFREHNSNMLGIKKGNVDTDIVFEIMKNLVDHESMQDVVLVSGDGDYKKLVDYLVKKDRLKKLLFPSNKFSSLYKKLTVKYFDILYAPFVRQKIEKKKRT